MKYLAYRTKETWIAEIKDGEKIEMKSDFLPSWFKRSVLDKLTRYRR